MSVSASIFLLDRSTQSSTLHCLTADVLKAGIRSSEDDSDPDNQKKLHVALLDTVGQLDEKPKSTGFSVFNDNHGRVYLARVGGEPQDRSGKVMG